MLESSLQTGKRIANLTLLEKIETTSTGIWYRAQLSDQPLQTALVKVLDLAQIPGTKRQQAQIRDHFHAEIRRLGDLHHPHLLALADVGQADGREFYVLSGTDGRSLRDLLAQHPGPVPLAQIAAWLDQLGSAVDALHDQDVVHGQITPEHLWLNAEGQVMLGGLEAVRPLAKTSDRAADLAAMGGVADWLVSGHDQAADQRRLDLPQAAEAAISCLVGRGPQHPFGTAAQFIQAFQAGVAGVTVEHLAPWSAALRPTVIQSRQTLARGWRVALAVLILLLVVALIWRGAAPTFVNIVARINSGAEAGKQGKPAPRSTATTVPGLVGFTSDLTPTVPYLPTPVSTQAVPQPTFVVVAPPTRVPGTPNPNPSPATPNPIPAPTSTTTGNSGDTCCAMYVFKGGPFTGIKAHWKLPQVSGPEQSGLSTWVQLGSGGSQIIIFVYILITNGTPQFTARYNSTDHGYTVTLFVPIAQGDEVSADVELTSNTDPQQWTLTFANITSGKSQTVLIDQTLSVNEVYMGVQLYPDPIKHYNHVLANFSPVTFMQSQVLVNGSWLPINQVSATEYNILGTAGQILATCSPIIGSQFTVTHT